MIVMWMLQTSLKGIEGVYRNATSLVLNVIWVGIPQKSQACKIGYAPTFLLLSFLYSLLICGQHHLLAKQLGEVLVYPNLLT